MIVTFIFIYNSAGLLCIEDVLTLTKFTTHITWNMEFRGSCEFVFLKKERKKETSNRE